MGLRKAWAAALLGSFGSLAIACGGGDGGGAPTAEGPGTDTSATDPAPPNGPGGTAGGEGATPVGGDEPPRAPAPLTLSPACGIPGYRVVLTLGLTHDHRVPSCYDVDDARVTFAPNEPATITVMGPTTDGFCAIDVEIPKSAETGKVEVVIGKDVFESDVLFGIPCP